MGVSIVICTWNRCELLRSTLESLCSLVVPADQQWEVVVVNNNSTDATDEVITAFQELLPLRRLFESELGASRARNAGVRAAMGELILFTDDDVRVDPNWMTAYLEAVARWPDAMYFGGVIRPWFAADVPRWVKRNETALAGMLCLLDLGPVSRRLQSGESPYGPNMAVRRAALELASFSERVGRKGHEQVRGSEPSLFLSLEQLGVPGVWVPTARVSHYIPGCRANFKYLWSYYRGNGRGAARLGIARELHPRWRLWTATLKALAQICLRPKDWPRRVATVAWMSGQYSESRQLVLHRNAPED
jgi:glycosyltransferase involved in cell wall biosynthesis